MLSYGSQGSKLTLVFVMHDQVINIHITHSVPVSETEGLVVHMLLYALDPSTGHGPIPGIHQGNFPGLGVHGMHLHLVVLHIEGDIGVVKEVVGKVFLNHITFVAAAYNEVIKTIMGIDLHDVPEDGFATYLHHGFGTCSAFFTYSCAESPGKKYYFHVFIVWLLFF